MSPQLVAYAYHRLRIRRLGVRVPSGAQQMNRKNAPPDIDRRGVTFRMGTSWGQRAVNRPEYAGPARRPASAGRDP